MAKLMWKGKTIEELNVMPMEELVNIVGARQRRSLKRGFIPEHKKFLADVHAWKPGNKPVRTHCRDMIIIPIMVGVDIAIYSGKEFVKITPTIEMIGHYLGEYVLTRRKVQHSAPGFGATRSSKFVPLK